jgi:N-succinyldiaminopimelate aminotransferase
MTRVPYLSARLQGFGTTVFAEMSALAVTTGSVNLGQGFPDYPGPSVLDGPGVPGGRGPGPREPDGRARFARKDDG